MSSEKERDYLWEAGGEPDPEVAELEKKLAPARYRPRPLPLPLPQGRRGRMGMRKIFLTTCVVAAAAGLLLVPVMMARRSAREEVEASPAVIATQRPVALPEIPSFAVKALAGAPALGDHRLTTDGALHVGGWLETDEDSRAEITVADIGAVRVEPRSRLRLVRTGPDQHRLELARGRISARVQAPPRLFVVDTPAATAVDLGCAYSMTVADDGSGTLHVVSGEVMLEGHGRTSTVPAGARAETRPGQGPGTPYAEDAPAPLRQALARLDFEDGGPRDVRTVLRAARRADAVTLEHLALRLDPAGRRQVEKRLCALTGCP